ncbi:hypothetical protein EXIGLDRAFT_754377 [Exidia glandulosa HHB12029]|uniref:Uncharacterized protein n=1 Tax=Exidia glandulosa HHB12029 TaxID=1314781 RepID=A0A165CYR0_EXIGL|nr:hypothetical protein EXIGLDRAFT_754377 [Exidia glandulosa HHB12029]
MSAQPLWDVISGWAFKLEHLGTFVANLTAKDTANAQDATLAEKANTAVQIPVELQIQNDQISYLTGYIDRVMERKIVFPDVCPSSIYHKELWVIIAIASGRRVNAKPDAEGMLNADGERIHVQLDDEAEQLKDEVFKKVFGGTESFGSDPEHKIKWVTFQDPIQPGNWDPPVDSDEELEDEYGSSDAETGSTSGANAATGPEQK